MMETLIVLVLPAPNLKTRSEQFLTHATSLLYPSSPANLHMAHWNHLSYFLPWTLNLELVLLSKDGSHIQTCFVDDGKCTRLHTA